LTPGSELEIESYWDRARESLDAARELVVMGHFDIAASRAYYAAFYAASAALMSRGKGFAKHSAVIASVHRDLVRQGLLEPAHGKALSVLFELRAIGDYGASAHVSEAEAHDAIRLAGDFVQAARLIARKAEDLAS